MKFHLAFVVAVIGVGMVAADENLTPVKATKDLEIEARDSEERCLRDTDDCDGHGVCQLSTFGRNERYTCLCALGYRNNIYGGCSPYTSREIEFLSYVARDLELEMLTRDSLGRCIADTQDCDGAGECKTKTTGRYRGEYICMCDDGYRNNAYGGCSPYTPREIEFLSYAARDLKLEMLTRDSLGRCIADTQDCDGAGECKTKTTGRYRGEYICVCDDGYRNNNYGGCSLIVTRATEVDDDDFTERKKEIMQQLVEFLQEE